jgi:precorrin-3B methylase
LPEPRGSLTVVGTGFEVPGHVTQQALASIETADQVLYLLTDPVAAEWIERVNPNARSLVELYEPGRNRAEIYALITDEVLACLRRGGAVCLALYGHPGVFVNPSHDAIRRARAEGFEARMLPGISADACLFADLGVDPAAHGCQSYEATDLLVHGRAIEPSAALIVWQAGGVGNASFAPEGDLTGLPRLVEYLRLWYPADHPVVVYEASPYAVVGPKVETVALADLATAAIWPMATLYLEAAQEAGAGDSARASRAATSLPFAS